MIANTHTPTVVSDGVVNTLHTCVALRLHGVASKSAGGRSTVAGAHENGIGCVPKVIGTGVFGACFLGI